MPDTDSNSYRLVQWFKNLVRPLFSKTEPESTLLELDKLAGQVEDLDENKDQLFPICLLGQAGVGKSTLINTLIAETGIVVPSGGGTGPLTANALRVIYGERPSFVVRYHTKKQINETRFILETKAHRNDKLEAQAAETAAEEGTELADIELDSDEQKQTRSEEAVGRACLLVAGAQSAQRELTYLVDALRWVLGQDSSFQTQITAEDMERLRQVQEALQYGTQKTDRHFDSADNPKFRQHLRHHACGFLAPLILDMTIHWPSSLLRDSVELIDLPGIGILSDVYASVTADYLRNRAKAVMLVADSRGVRREDAELLRNSGFLNRLLHASDDLAADPVALIVVTVKIDDVAVENWRNDKALNEVALKTKAEHFADVVENCRRDITQGLQTYLREVWQDQEGVISEGKQEVIEAILAGLQVFPVSAPQYRLHLTDDPDDDRPFLPDVESTNIIGLRASIEEIARQCIVEKNRRSKETRQRFLGQLRARLEILSARGSEEKKAEGEISKLKKDLEKFMAPLQREFDNRRGGFRNFLRKTIPAEIEAKVEAASNKARKEIHGYLRSLQGAHWKTLQAAVRKEGTFYGSRHINLPHDFALRFEEPVAEVWSRKILVALRRETREFAEYQSGIVTQVLDWAKGQNIGSSTRLLEALVEDVKQHQQQVNAVGKEAVDDLRDKVRLQLIKKIESPIRRRCKRFVSDQKDYGTGVKARILELFERLAEKVVEAASEPAITLLVEKFKEVDKEILTAFREHGEPLADAADAIVQRKEKRLQKVDNREDDLLAEIESVIASTPEEEAAE